MNCNEALTILVEPDHNARPAALDYLKAHPECLARVDQLARTLTTVADDDLPCAEARERLADYYTRQQMQKDAAQQFPQVHTHLDRCPYCQLEYAALTALMAAHQTGTLSPVTVAEPFDLKFLEELPAIWTIDGTVRKLTAQIAVTISKAQAAIDALVFPLQPVSHVMAMRGEDDIHYAVLSIPDESAAVRFDFDVKPTPNGMANVTLSLTQSMTNQPLPDVRIAVQKADGTLLARSLTDSAGKLELPQLNADTYIIQARNDNNQWEIPITIVAES